MSATPPNPPSGRTPTGPNGLPPRIRRPKPADPLVRPKKRPIPRPRTSSMPPTRPSNGVIPTAPPPPRTNASQSKAVPRADDMTVNGFTGPLLSENYVDYPLVTTKRAWREGLKHHMARFASKKAVDPRNESQFIRPVRLQRRDPRAKPPDATNDRGGDRKGEPGRGNGLDETEREALEARKAAREKEREENLAQIAPSAATGQKRTITRKQKTQQVFKAEMTAEEIAKARIKYEEALPWHLEDFDNKNTWVGNYEAALSDTYVMFVLENDGKMRMVPIEKWYKFTAKNHFKALTIEEAEKHMAKKIKDPRWFMEKEHALAQQKELEQYARQNKVYAGKHGATSGGGGLEGDEMDFEEDRFADDEEHVGLFDEDEDAKSAEKRIKKDQLKANIFDLKQEKDYDEEEMQEKKEKEELKNFGKRVRKALQKREKNYDYSSGSDNNPFSEDESSEDTETEQLKEEQRKAEEERVRREKGKDSDRNSAASTKGSNTPSGRQKHTDALKKAATASARKRPGSPNLSDASGTDTSRKKPKNKHASSQPTSTSTPQPGSRPLSPVPSSAPAASAARKGTMDPSKASQATAKKRNRFGQGAGSEGDADMTAGSGGEMSEGGSKVKKLKLNMSGAVSPQGGTPQGSRAGSPLPLGSRAVAGSRASSPDGRAGLPTRTATPGISPSPASFPTATEIHAAIPPTGIVSSDLLKIFRPRIGDSKENHRRFIAIVKDVSVYGKEDKMLRPGPLKNP